MLLSLINLDQRYNNDEYNKSYKQALLGTDMAATLASVGANKTANLEQNSTQKRERGIGRRGGEKTLSCCCSSPWLGVILLSFPASTNKTEQTGRREGETGNHIHGCRKEPNREGVRGEGGHLELEWLDDDAVEVEVQV